MIYVKKVATLVSLALLLGSSSLLAQSNAMEQQVVQKDGSALLKGSYNYLGALDKYAFDASITNTVVVDGANVVGKRTSDVKVNRPAQFRVDTKGDYINRSVYLSNGVFAMIDNKEKYYATVNTGGDIDKTLEQISKKLGIVLPISTLMHSNMGKFNQPKRVQYFGTRDVSGVECNYIAYKRGGTTVHLWIENSNTPVIRSAKIITAEKGTTDMVMKWDTNPGFSDSAFIFKAPKGASNVSIKPAK